MFGRRALPGTRWGSISAPLDPLAAIGGGVLLLKGIEGRGRKGKEREGKEDGRGGGQNGGIPPFYLTSGYRPGHTVRHHTTASCHSMHICIIWLF